MHRRRQVFIRHGQVPRAFRAAPRADLGDDYQVFGIRMKCFADELIGDVRPIVVAGVDVIDAARDGVAQPGERGFVVDVISGHIPWEGAIAGRRELPRTMAELGRPSA